MYSLTAVEAIEGTLKTLFNTKIYINIRILSVTDATT
jgi:hypothetical protein